MFMQTVSPFRNEQRLYTTSCRSLSHKVNQFEPPETQLNQCRGTSEPGDRVTSTVYGDGEKVIGPVCVTVPRAPARVGKPRGKAGRSLGDKQ
jgi:hypothetical protein